MPKKTNKSNTKYMKTLHQYNNKRVIIIAEYSGKDERVVPIIEKGILGTIKNCNSIQKDIEFTFFSLQDEDNTAIGIMVDDDCPFEDITIKSFFVAQMATFSGLFFEKFAAYNNASTKTVAIINTGQNAPDSNLHQ